MSEPPVPTRASGVALFLDVDGTLAEIAPNPDDVRLSPAIIQRLERIRGRLHGALALVSGRALAAIDRLTDPARFTVAGVHGAEWRDAGGGVHRVSFDASLLDPARRAFGPFAVRHPGVWVEDKGAALALHYRANPGAGDAAGAIAREAAAAIGPAVAVLEGKMIVEVRCGDATKAHAVERFLAAPPFAGRRPVYFGDDVTDEDAFRAVNARDGISARVAPEGAAEGTAARYGFHSVADVHRWLDGLARRLSGVP